MSEADVNEKEFYRYISMRELGIIKKTGLLRGGRSAGEDQTFWTEDLYRDRYQAQARLALRTAPEVRVRFTIKSEPNLERRGGVVVPDGGQPGGGTEWSSYEAVEVNLPLLEEEVLSEDFD